MKHSAGLVVLSSAPKQVRVGALHGDALTLTGKKQGKGQDVFGGPAKSTDGG